MIKKFNPYARKHAQGYRSGLEERVARELAALLKHPVDYETTKIQYQKPPKNSTYTPDFILPNGVIIETKGRFLTEDRQKHLLVKEQHPELDIRFVFSNPNSPINKGSKTTYAKWCEKHGFQYAAKSVPESWVREPGRTL